MVIVMIKVMVMQINLNTQVGLSFQIGPSIPVGMIMKVMLLLCHFVAPEGGGEARDPRKAGKPKKVRRFIRQVPPNKQIDPNRVKSSLVTSMVDLTPQELLLLERGLNFKIPFATSKYNMSIRSAIESLPSKIGIEFNRLLTHSEVSLPCRDPYISKKLAKLNPFKLLHLPHRSLPGLNRLVKGHLDLLVSQRGYNNLTHIELQALATLRSRKDIVITSADKGGGLIVMGTDTYVKSGMATFGDINNYVQLGSVFDPVKCLQDQMTLNNNIMYKLLLSKCITNNMYETAIKPAFTYASAYFTFKTHKPLNSEGTYPNRPIVASFNCTFRYLDQYLELILFKLAKFIPSKINRSAEVLEKVLGLDLMQRGTVYLASLDIEQMFPSLNHYDTAKVVSEFFDDHKGHLRTLFKPFNINLPSCNFIKYAILTVLRNNIIKFNNNYFKPLQGVAMGSCSSVILSDLYVHVKIETKISLHAFRILFYGRFVDDIFLLLEAEEDLNLLKEYMNSLSNLKFTKEGPAQTLNFLDFTLTISGDNISSRIYKKPSAKNNYLHFDSHSPLAQKRAIFINQVHRITTLTTDPLERIEVLSQSKQEFLDKGYPDTLLETWALQAVNHGSRGCKEGHGRVKLICPYSAANHSKILNLLGEIKTYIQLNYSSFPWCMDLLPKLVYRSSDSLGQVLTRSRKDV